MKLSDTLPFDPLPRRISSILRGDPASAPAAIRGEIPGYALASSLAILFGCVSYGAAVGFWRSPWQALFLAVKFPALVFATFLCNGILNGMLAQVLGTGLSFTQTFRAILMSFASFSAILGALSPVALFIALGAPSPDPGNLAPYRSFVLSHTALIAYAGIAANLHMLDSLSRLAPPKAARLTFFAWSAGSLFVGGQLAWNLRPFFGSPAGDVTFLRPDAFDGSFYEAVATLLLRQLHRSFPL